MQMEMLHNWKQFLQSLQKVELDSTFCNVAETCLILQ